MSAFDLDNPGQDRSLSLFRANGETVQKIDCAVIGGETFVKIHAVYKPWRRVIPWHYGEGTYYTEEREAREEADPGKRKKVYWVGEGPEVEVLYQSPTGAVYDQKGQRRFSSDAAERFLRKIRKARKPGPKPKPLRVGRSVRGRRLFKTRAAAFSHAKKLGEEERSLIREELRKLEEQIAHVSAGKTGARCDD